MHLPRFLRKLSLGVVLSLSCTVATAPVPAAAATVKGTVAYEGRAPRMRPLPVDADPQCKAMHENDPLLTEFLVLGEGQTMANVIVRITGGLPKGKTYPVPTDPVVVSQHGCRYDPHVFVVRAGQPVKFSNPDGLQHNVHPLPDTNREVNRAMSEKEREFTHVFPKAEAPFRIKCDVHNWMEAYCAVLDHPYFAVTGKDGQFTIGGLPPGEYTIEAWHEVLGTRTAKVTVKEDEPAVANFTFTRPKHK